MTGVDVVNVLIPKLLDMGIISKEEFEKKKKELLNL